MTAKTTTNKVIEVLREASDYGLATALASATYLSQDLSEISNEELLEAMVDQAKDIALLGMVVAMCGSYIEQSETSEVIELMASTIQQKIEEFVA